ncbi:MAG: ferritin family protein [Desulfobacter sp.]|nr:ferritin family protein [Desulfobacter sp.]WDP84163.1 MAG: ferritin family protein [Desulfobacter sp.]
MFTLNDLFDIALKMEENGKAVYCRAMKKTEKKDLQTLLKWMADEEDSHRSWFQDQKRRLPKDGGDLEVMLPDVLKEMMGENTLSLDEVAFSKINTQAQMIKTFIMFENDTILFYEFLETFIESGSSREGLNKIIQEETAHVEKLNTMIESVQDLPIENT